MRHMRHMLKKAKRFTNGQKVVAEELARAVDPEGSVRYLSCWISPNGDIYIVDDRDHADFIDKYYRKEVAELRKNENFLYILPMDYAFKNGWIRVVIHPQLYKFYATGTQDGVSRNYSVLKHIEDVTGFRFETFIRVIKGDVILWKERKKSKKSEAGSISFYNFYKIAKNYQNVYGKKITSDELYDKVVGNIGYSFSGMMSPEGDLYEVLEHTSFINNALILEIKALEKKNNINGKVFKVWPYQFAYNRGWLRVYVTGGSLTIEGNDSGVSSRYSYLNSLAKQLNVSLDIHKENREDGKYYNNSYNFNWYKLAKLNSHIENRVPFDAIMEIVSNGHNSGWLSPTGEYYSLESYDSHEDFMKRIYSGIAEESDVYKEFKKDYEKGMISFSFTEFGYVNGWVRIVFYDYPPIIEAMGSSNGLSSEHLQRLKEATGLRLETVVVSKEVYAGVKLGIKIGSGFGKLITEDYLYDFYINNMNDKYFGFSGWLSPTGEIYEVSDCRHAKFLNELLSEDIKQFINNHKDKNNIEISIYGFAYTRGWVRLYITKGELSAESNEFGLNASSARLQSLSKLLGCELSTDVMNYSEVINLNKTSFNLVNWYKTAQIVRAIPYDEIAVIAKGDDRKSQIFGWLAPDGSFYIVPFEGHSRFIHEFIGGKDNYKNAEKEANMQKKFFSPTSYAFKRGWIRIGINFMGDKLVDAEGTPAGLSSENLRRLKEVLGFRLELSYRNVG